MSSAGRLFQQLIREIGPRISVDGIVGPGTMAALASLETQAQRSLRSVASMLGLDLPVSLDREAVEGLCRNVSRRTNVPVSYLVKTVYLENASTNGVITVEYFGKYRGIGQFDKRTWESVMDASYDTTDPEVGLIAVAKLYLANERSFRAKFGKARYTDGIAYLYHNQGASAAASFIRTGDLRYPKQSNKALEVFKYARNAHVSAGLVA